MVLHRYGVLLLSFACLCSAFAAMAPPRTFLTLQLPADVDPTSVQILFNQGNNDEFTHIKSKVEEQIYTIPVQEKTTVLRLVLVRPGYRIIAQNFPIKTLPNTPYIPRFETLATIPLTLKVRMGDGTPISGEQVSLSTILPKVNPNFIIGLHIYIATWASGVTDDAGVVTLHMPALLDDPFLTDHTGKQRIYCAINIQKGKWNSRTPDKILIQHAYPEPIVVTVSPQGELHGNIATEYIRRQHLSGEITPHMRRDITGIHGEHRIVLNAEADNGVVVNLQMDASGTFMTTVPPGNYHLVLVEINHGNQVLKRVPLDRQVSIKEGEDQEIRVLDTL